jgi:hypothetical protein
MHPRIRELMEHLRLQREVLRAAAERVPVSQHRQRPAPDRWSVAEVLEHLSIIETRVAGLISSLVAKGKAAGLRNETETTPVLDARQKAMFLDRNRKTEARESGQPSGQLDTASAWDALHKSRRALSDAVSAADGLALGELSYSHPVTGSLSVYDWIAFVGWHEARHAAQIDEIAAALTHRTEP